jgi:hypothetical protein
MGKYTVVQFDEAIRDSGPLRVIAPDGRILIENLHTLEQAKEVIRRDRKRTRLPVVTPGTVVYEEDE